VIEGNEQKAVVDLNRLAPIYHQLAAVVRVTPDGRANRLLTELGQEIGVVPDPLKAALEALQALQATKLVEVQDSYVRRIFRHVRRGENLGAALGLIEADGELICRRCAAEVVGGSPPSGNNRPSTDR
jgi:hypothetical protein